MHHPPRAGAGARRVGTTTRRALRALVLGPLLGGAVLAAVVVGGLGPYPGLVGAATGATRTLAAGSVEAGATAGPIEGLATWEACRDIDVLVDPTAAPAGWDTVLPAAVERISQEQGVDVRFAGTAEAGAAGTPLPDEPTRVYLTWATPDSEPRLSDEAAVTTHIAGGPAGDHQHVVFAWSVLSTGAATPVDAALAEIFPSARAPRAEDAAHC